VCDCPPGFTGAQCQSVTDMGKTCSVDSQCETKHCSNGVCCDRACDGECERCGVDGVCVAAIDRRCGAVCGVCRATPLATLLANVTAPLGRCRAMSSACPAAGGRNDTGCASSSDACFEGACVACDGAVECSESVGDAPKTMRVDLRRVDVRATQLRACNIGVNATAEPSDECAVVWRRGLGVGIDCDDVDGVFGVDERLVLTFSPPVSMLRLEWLALAGQVDVQLQVWHAGAIPDVANSTTMMMMAMMNSTMMNSTDDSGVGNQTTTSSPGENRRRQVTTTVSSGTQSATSTTVAASTSTTSTQSSSSTTITTKQATSSSTSQAISSTTGTASQSTTTTTTTTTTPSPTEPPMIISDMEATIAVDADRHQTHLLRFYAIARLEVTLVNGTMLLQQLSSDDVLLRAPLAPSTTAVGTTTTQISTTDVSASQTSSNETTSSGTNTADAMLDSSPSFIEQYWLYGAIGGGALLCLALIGVVVACVVCRGGSDPDFTDIVCTFFFLILLFASCRLLTVKKRLGIVDANRLCTRRIVARQLIPTTGTD
jgi:hypothetical protein